MSNEKKEMKPLTKEMRQHEKSINARIKSKLDDQQRGNAIRVKRNISHPQLISLFDRSFYLCSKNLNWIQTWAPMLAKDTRLGEGTLAQIENELNDEIQRAIEHFQGKLNALNNTIKTAKDLSANDKYNIFVEAEPPTEFDNPDVAISTPILRQLLKLYWIVNDLFLASDTLLLNGLRLRPENSKVIREGLGSIRGMTAKVSVAARRIAALLNSQGTQTDGPAVIEQMETEH